MAPALAQDGPAPAISAADTAWMMATTASLALQTCRLLSDNCGPKLRGGNPLEAQKISEMLEINKDQKNYYEVASGGSTHEVNSAATNTWRRLRSRVLGVFDGTAVAKSIDDLHRQWMGDLSGKKVLELGVGNGSPFSREMAHSAREYVAIDLSQSRIDELRKKVGTAENVKLYATDFLSAEAFPEEKFDLIYAMAVFHHFKHLDALLDVVERKLAPGGQVITYDPVKVWWGARLLRAAFRPFQTDAAWEHPFAEQSLATIEKRFRVLHCQGIMGKAKWACIAGAISPAAGRRLAQQWHEDDLRTMTATRTLRSCLQVSYHLQKMP
ncbi:class I SAM-dependent methyltransferase [Rhodopseudomonas pseudopalustris]|uniref:class I SAM-dependent methyltransferase n=1 Tax=Rhodopseudomonas pseudopalustris TaxID=1513892 RepID=UPI0011137649|nr:class I SAM-dependent methyltransferase [Rhodopseudomonas pseudopalustris]